jgi:hypothetical protein
VLNHAAVVLAMIAAERVTLGDCGESTVLSTASMP